MRGSVGVWVAALQDRALRARGDPVSCRRQWDPYEIPPRQRPNPAPTRATAAISRAAHPHAEDLDSLVRRRRYQADENQQVTVPAR